VAVALIFAMAAPSSVAEILAGAGLPLKSAKVTSDATDEATRQLVADL